MLTIQEINEISNKLSMSNKVDMRFVLMQLNDLGAFDKEQAPQTKLPQAEHVAQLRGKIEDPPLQDEVQAIQARLNDLIGALTDAEIIK